MRNTHLLGIFSGIFFFLICSLPFAGDTKQDAIKAAEQWLTLFDAKNYGKSWDEASELFKKSITKEMWCQSIKAVRPAFGDLISRNMSVRLRIE